MLRILLILQGICEIRLYHYFKGLDARLREKEVTRHCAGSSVREGKTKEGCACPAASGSWKTGIPF
jgi:hypothetical protein